MGKRKAPLKPLVRRIEHNGDGPGEQCDERRNIYTRRDGSRYVMAQGKETELQTDDQGDFYEIHNQPAAVPMRKAA